MRRTAFLLATLFSGAVFAQSTWILSSADGRAVAGERFEVELVAPRGSAPPAGVELRLRALATDVRIHLEAAAPADGERRRYAGTMPPSVAGVANLELEELASNVLVLRVAKPDALQGLLTARPDEAEALLSDNEPMYFILGARDGYTGRFQLSFKYRLFDAGSGYGKEQPWLSGFYFAYTQTSVWDLSADSKPFRDTSYRPSLFWKWERTDARTWIHAVRAGAEHESNGRDGPLSRSLNTFFVRPEWHWAAGAGRLEFTPRLNFYTNTDENPDIAKYRGYVDWRVRYDTGDKWIATAVARTGTAWHGSLQLELARRTRDLQVGSIGGYFFVQYFDGYGENLLDYKLRRNSQLRIGLAIVP